MPKRPLAWVLLAAAGLLANHAAHADVFRCTGPAGKTLFTDRPCPDGMKTTDLTASVQVCGTADCQLRRDRAHQEAEARRRAEREALAAMMEERHRRAQEEAWLDALRLRAATAPAPVAPTEYFDPGYAVAGAPVWTACVGPHCMRPVHHRLHRAGSANKPKPSWNCIDERCAPGGREEAARPKGRSRI